MVNEDKIVKKLATRTGIGTFGDSTEITLSGLPMNGKTVTHSGILTGTGTLSLTFVRGVLVASEEAGG